MSFGYSIGDFIKILELANEIRSRFIDSPRQFIAVSNEVTGLSNVVRDIEGVARQQELTDWQKKALLPILEECHNVLIALGKVVDENYCLKAPNPGGLRDKSRRVWKRLIWEPSDIRDLRLRITLNVSLLNAFNGSLTSKLTLATKQSVDRLHERQDNRELCEERQAILDWLTIVDYAPQQCDFINRRQEGTGQWLLNSKEFNEWLDQSKQTLFCPGIPGAGKTIITSIVINHLHFKFRNDPTVGIAYLYCNFRQQHQQRPIDLLLSLLKQLVQTRPSMPKSLKSLYERYKDMPGRPLFDEVMIVLHSVVADYSRTFLIIDALDECQVCNGDRRMFLSEIFNLRAKSGGNIFVTSRFIPEIEREFEGCPSLEIHASPQDVIRYLDSRILKLSSFLLGNITLQNEIKTAILEVVDGMFLLAELHLASLIGKRSPKAIKAALRKLPRGSDAYDHAYKEAMGRIEGQTVDSRELAMQVLSWITCAKRPLTTIELRHALAVEVGELSLDEENLPEIEDMISVCAGLVTVDKESDIIRLVHYTTQEYFERTWKVWFPNAERDIATTCITYLLFDAFKTGFCYTDEDFEAQLQLNPFYDYAARNWGHHAHGVSGEMEQLILDFLESEAKVSSSCQVMMVSRHYPGYSQRVPEQMTGLHLAAYFGLREATIALLENGQCLNSSDSYSRTPVLYAARYGHVAVVKLLLEKGAELDIKGGKFGQTPLSWAAEFGHGSVVKLLLEEGAELETKDTRYGRTPLSWAADKGHEAAARLLLEKGAELATKDTEYGRTPLLWAAVKGHEAVVKLLLEKGAELETKDIKYGRTLLSYAAEKGHEAVMKLLLEKGAQMEIKDTKDGRTPLSYAAENGHEAAVKQLLEKGVNPDSKGNDCRAPLSWAAMKGHEAVVKLLLEKGAEPEIKDKIHGWTPLSWAARYGQEAVVKLLLENGAELEVKDKNYGRTPLSWAAGKGHEAVAGMLVEKGAKLESKDTRYGRTPLSWAAANGQEAVVKLLVEKGAELETKDIKYGRTPLSWALANGYKAVVELLLGKGAELETEDVGESVRQTTTVYMIA